MGALSQTRGRNQICTSYYVTVNNERTIIGCIPSELVDGKPGNKDRFIYPMEGRKERGRKAKTERKAQ